MSPFFWNVACNFRISFGVLSDERVFESELHDVISNENDAVWDLIFLVISYLGIIIH